MRKLVTLLVISTVVLASCSRDSRLRPSNWFTQTNSGAVAAPTQPPAEVNPLIPERKKKLSLRKKQQAYLGSPLEQVTNVTVERIPTGAIINVTGVSQRQGAFDVRLTSDTNGDPVDGVLSFRLKALQPLNTPQGSERLRTVRVARFVSNHDLAKANTIQIIAVRNVQTTQQR